MKKISIFFFSFFIFVNSAFADLLTNLETIEDEATGTITIIQTSNATVIASVFGLVLLAVGAKWIFGSIKSR